MVVEVVVAWGAVVGGGDVVAWPRCARVCKLEMRRVNGMDGGCIGMGDHSWNASLG